MPQVNGGPPITRYIGTNPSGCETYEIDEDVVAFVHSTGTGGRSNSVVVTADGGALVIDTMLTPVLADDIRTELRRRRSRPHTVLNTHPHVDHLGGNLAFPDATALSSPETATMASNLARDTSFLPRLFPRHADQLDGLRIRVPQAVVDTGWQLPYDARPLPLGPAHSPGDVAVWLERQRVLVAGDLCFHEVTPLALPGHADLHGWIAALDFLITLQPRVVVPGHGPVGGPVMLTQVRDYLLALTGAAERVLQRAQGRDDALGQLRRGPLAGWSKPDRTGHNLAVAMVQAAGHDELDQHVAPLLRTRQDRTRPHLPG